MAFTSDVPFPGNVRARGRGYFEQGVELQPGDVKSDSADPSDPLPATVLQHQHQLVYRQDGTVVAATNIPIYVSRGAGTIVGIKASVVTVATGADRALTIDLKAGKQGVALATQLTGPISIDETVAALQVFEGTLIVDPSYGADETLTISITVAGAAGAQAVGLVVTVTVREDADE